MFYFDSTYIIFVLPALLLALLAKWYVNSTYEKYSKKYSSRGMTGAQAAKAVLNANGVFNVQIYQVSGKLTDHYDPKSNAIYLSNGVHSSNSVAAIGVAAHEAGHAVQYAKNYYPIKFRMKIYPVANIGSQLAIPLIIAGFLLGSFSDILFELVYVGIICFAASTLFELVTLPVEFNASRRAVTCINENGILTEEELGGAKSVLRAAAMTYVAALAVSVMQLLRFIVLANRRDRD